MSSRSSRSSSPAEERRIIENWQPEPLVPEEETNLSHHILKPHVITSKPGKFITIDGKRCLNLGTHNYLGLADDPRLDQASIEAVRKYGVGSCGPRAFYGTMDVHLKLEEELAEFLNVQETVLYSFGFSTIASAIPAYAKSTDVIFVDECCNFAIQQGIVASKSKVIKFKHNDIKHLEQSIEDLFNERRKIHGKPKSLRTFLIVESIYAKTGDLCPLAELIELKKRFKIRLFIDESRSMGVLGTEGKGISQHFNADINDIDLIMVSLENAFCAYGGFCAGSTFVIDHQRLAGAGYCFSASLPPLQTQVALTSLRIIRDEPSIVTRSQEVFQYAHEVLKNLTRLQNISHPLSPIKLLVLKSSNSPTTEATDKYSKDDEIILEGICSKLLVEENLAVSVARRLEDEEMTRVRASIRMIVSGSLLHSDIDRAFQALESRSLSLPRQSSSVNVAAHVLSN